jgi:large subunit ribosomal protein L30
MTDEKPAAKRTKQSSRKSKPSELKVRQIRSGVGGTTAQKATLRTLGLRRIGDEVVRADRPEFRGMIKSVAHLVTVEEVE